VWWLSSQAETSEFSQAGFWAAADSMYHDYGGGFWLWAKETEIKSGWIGGWKTATTYHWQLVVLDADAMEEYADVIIPLRPSTKLTHLSAKTIDSEGDELPLDHKNVFERPRTSDYMLYSDQREMVFAMPGYGDSCVLEVLYTVAEDAVQIAAEATLGQGLPIRHAKYTYRLQGQLANRGVGVVMRGYNMDCRPEVNEVYSDHLFNSYSWELHNVPAYPDETWMPPRERLVPRVLIGARFGGKPEPDWQGFARYYDSVLPDTHYPASEIKDLAAALTGGAEDEISRIKRIADFVSKNIRYVAIDLGESGYKPNDPAAVLAHKYGDCKDMSVLAIALLRQAGVDAYPALLLRRSEGLIDKDLLVPRFNHMIVYVEASGGRIAWLDPTAGPCPFGYLPFEDMGVDALVVKAGTALWRRTPDYTIHPSRRRSFTAMSLTDDGTIEGSMRLGYDGAFALSRLHLLDQTAKKDEGGVIEELIGSYVPDARIGSGRMLSGSYESLSLTVAADFSTSPRNSHRPGEISVDLTFPEPMVYRLVSIEVPPGRQSPLWFPYEWDEIDTVCVNKPRSCLSCVQPEAFDLKSEYGSGSLWCSESDSQLVVVREYALRADSVGIDQIEDFVAFWESIKGRSRGRVTFGVARD
jgi:hypothetical protein